MKTLISLFCGFILSVPLFAQMHVVSVEKLPLGAEQQWSQPIFSPDGARIYFTSAGFNGIWEYTPSTKSVRHITDAPRSGFGFALSNDGKTISYRRTFDEASRSRTQELVTQNLSSGAVNVLEKGESVSLPKFSQSSVIYLKEGKVANAASTESANVTAVLGIEDTKIVLLKNGVKVSFDPLGNGSYIWPSLSPDGTKLLAYEMDRGVFISDLDGKIVKMVGRKDNPVWTRDGKWIVYMDDKDDGHNILGSDIYCVSSDGATTVRLTNTSDVIELYPSCSPVENKIVCSSLSGDVYVITYSEEGAR
jgi:Tol biopolymer transport system component